ncbi:hypothetical protein BJ322DRAFT_675374 [Thelephora terrestris]|uniref:Uncharacterized protein n=1 Tax=Thelephora terrestris TaxID=56493 RepID=A0A9P6HGH2_9AGAM|nr:hypothetical protein BJ322DRAFT_675374 [Thelephora terrestris]
MCYFTVIFTLPFRTRGNVPPQGLVSRFRPAFNTATVNLITVSSATASGILVFTPLMISRIKLSLRKAADTLQATWPLMQDTTPRMAILFNLQPPSSEGSIREEDTATSLDTFRDPFKLSQSGDSVPITKVFGPFVTNAMFTSTKSVHRHVV